MAYEKLELYGGRAWPVDLIPKQYPVHKLPTVFFLDNEAGLSIAKAKTMDEAKKIQAGLAWKMKLVIRMYAPGPEEYELLCEEQRKRRRWASSFGA